MIRRILVVLGIAAVSLVLAFPLRNAVYAMIIVPFAYVFWLLGLVYRSINQSLWWGLASLIVIFILLLGLWPQPRPKKTHAVEHKKAAGQVETLSLAMKKAERGIYFKWLIANRVGRIAFQILARRETGKERSFFDPLAGPSWEPNPNIQAYLETGLHGSFADYPQKSRFFTRPISTPMDHDVSEVIEYLEMQIED
jgi:hypothetical protein